MPSLIGPAIVDAVSDLGFVTGGGLIVLIVVGVVLEVRRRRGRRDRSDVAGPGQAEGVAGPRVRDHRCLEQASAPSTGPSPPS